MEVYYVDLHGDGVTNMLIDIEDAATGEWVKMISIEDLLKLIREAAKEADGDLSQFGALMLDIYSRLIKIKKQPIGRFRW